MSIVGYTLNMKKIAKNVKLFSNRIIGGSSGIYSGDLYMYIE